MSVASRPYLSGPPEPRHAGREEYAAFLRTRARPGQRKRHLLAYTRFVAEYPDLRDWFAAPLPERVGALRGTGERNASALARPYLYFLALRGRARFDWEWILAVGFHVLPRDLLDPAVDGFIGELVGEAAGLGYGRPSAERKLRRPIKHLYLRRLVPGVLGIRDAEIEEFDRAARAFAGRPDVGLYHGSAEDRRRASRGDRQALYALRVVLYHRGRLAAEPKITRSHPRRPCPSSVMGATVERYLRAQRAQHTRPATIERMGCELRRFIEWLARRCPEVETFAELTRERALEYAASLETAVSSRTGRPLSIETKITRLSTLSVFFRDAASWGWEDAPARPLLGSRDLPKRPHRVPRYIPEDELARLMAAVRELERPYQWAALLVARWSGARRGEIRDLYLDCLDSYPDGTPRLRIPVGKGKSERIVPVHDEAARAIRELQALSGAGRGFLDEQTGVEARRLFVRRGQRCSAHYLFYASLDRACRTCGLVDGDGEPTVNPHRFRHTVGAELAEGGARLHTIMKMLGHTSTEMTLVYAHISDKAVLEDYKKVLGPGAAIAGLIAEELRSGQLPRESVEWLKSNFLKTELELGHCLRLPQEGPCECELYLSCAKFVTTPEYAPRLRGRRLRELELVEDAASRGWDREVERHRCAVRRIEQLLDDLGEPVDGADAPR